VVAVAVEEEVGDVAVVGDAVVELVPAPVGRLKTDVGAAVVAFVAVPVLVTVRKPDGTRRGPVPDGGRTRVATMVACVFGSALETPMHMLYAVSVAPAAAD